MERTTTGTTERPDDLTTEDLARGRRPQDDVRRDSPAETSDPDDGRTETRQRPVATTEPGEERMSLFDDARSTDLRSRWESIQASFVDEPRDSVAEADKLVAEVLEELARTFAKERKSLEQEWTLGDEVSTEDLRQALRHYRSFFDRLLTI